MPQIRNQYADSVYICGTSLRGFGGKAVNKSSHVRVLVAFVFAFVGIAAAEVTELSQTASRLQTGMSRQSVIDLLGHPTWAVIPGDSGELALPDPRIGLELYWQNSPCGPVIVQFSATKREVTGWDEGRAICGEGSHLLEPSASYSCDKSDRVNYCH